MKISFGLPPSFFISYQQLVYQHTENGKLLNVCLGAVESRLAVFMPHCSIIKKSFKMNESRKAFFIAPFRWRENLIPFSLGLKHNNNMKGLGTFSPPPAFSCHLLSFPLFLFSPSSSSLSLNFLRISSNEFHSYAIHFRFFLFLLTIINTLLSVELMLWRSFINSHHHSFGAVGKPSSWKWKFSEEFQWVLGSNYYHFELLVSILRETIVCVHGKQRTTCGINNMIECYQKVWMNIVEERKCFHE